MEYELKTFVNMTHGPSAWNEILALQGKIRKDRQRMIYEQQERRREILNAIGIILLVCLIGGTIVGGVMMAVDIAGHPRLWFK